LVRAETGPAFLISTVESGKTRSNSAWHQIQSSPIHWPHSGRSLLYVFMFLLR
jgi:hypothetical protein